VGVVSRGTRRIFRDGSDGTARRDRRADQNPAMLAASARLDPRRPAAIFAGGAAGALARAGLAHAFPAGPSAWPWTTFAVNAAGCFLLAALVVRLQERLPPSTYRRPFLGTGLCGALTTFSTVQVEAIRMARAGAGGLAAAYLAASVIAGLAAVVAATALVRRAWTLR
jgi:fluoride exporter